MNSYPFLDNKTHPTCEAYLGDIVPPMRKHRMIDISASPLIPARELREKLDYLLMAGELDSGLPIVRDGVLMGLIPVPDLEYALDKLEDEDDEACVMSVDTPLSDAQDDNDVPQRLNDFTTHIDPVRSLSSI
jgi:chloride channel 3/4/5